MLKLYIGNKNYSSWSMRPWVLLKQAGIPFEEVMVRFGSLTPDSPFKQTISALHPLGKVPLLVDGDLLVADSLAICEYVAESYPDLNLWPANKADRALARSLCAEMHAGFNSLRQHCGMNIEARLPEVGAVALRDQPGVRADLARIIAIWMELLARSGGPMLMGQFSILDAYFAPVATRITTYNLPVPESISAYIDRLYAQPGVQAWISEALAEHDFVPVDEPYRIAR